VKQRFPRSLYAATQGVENDVSARLPDIPSASCNCDHDFLTLEVSRSCPNPVDHLSNFALNRFIEFVFKMQCTNRQIDNITFPALAYA